MISRLITDKIIKTTKSVLILGPRQVGKSTLIRSLNPELIINLADEKTYLNFKSNPDQLREMLLEKKYKSVFIDEIQTSPELLNTIQSILDEQPVNKKTKFYLTGSSARKLKRGNANLLPGRIFAYEIGPLCAAELNYELDSHKAMSVGCLPEPYLSTSEDAIKLLETYSGVYLKEEIQAESLTRDLQGFSRFIIEAANSACKILDYSKIAKNAKIERKNATRFFEILEDTLIAHKIEPFELTAAEIKKRPKYYFFDPGVLNGLLKNFEVSGDRKGELFENLIVTQILASAKAKDININLNYFRTKAGYEVDFILEINKKYYAIEAKSGTVDKGDVKKIEFFSQYYPNIEKYFILTPSGDPRKINQTTICDLNYFLKNVGL